MSRFVLHHALRVAVHLLQSKAHPISPSKSSPPATAPGKLLERVSFYMRTGVSLLWVVDPADERVTVYRPGESPSTFQAPAVINAAPVLPDFELDLAALFAILPDEE
jgi:Uma2 family endonuclease